MSKDELINLLRDIRLSRRTPKKKIKTKKPAAKKSKSINVDAMTDEQALKLLQELEGKLDD